MFNSIGGKLRVIAKIYFWLMIVLSGVMLFLMFVSMLLDKRILNGYTIFMSLISIAAIDLSGWITAMLIHAVGDIYDCSADAAYHARQVNNIIYKDQENRK